MPHSDTSFRAAAEECRSLAARTTDPIQKQEFQHAADDWLRLAQLAGVTHPPEPAGDSFLDRSATEHASIASELPATAPSQRATHRGTKIVTSTTTGDFSAPA